jgi:hypothetical protein
MATLTTPEARDGAGLLFILCFIITLIIGNEEQWEFVVGKILTKKRKKDT